MSIILKMAQSVRARRTFCASKFNLYRSNRQSGIMWSIALISALLISITLPEPAYAQNLESFASNVRGLLSSTLLRTLAVIAVIVTGLLWFTGRASTAVLVTVIIGIAIVFSADSIVGLIAG